MCIHTLYIFWPSLCSRRCTEMNLSRKVTSSWPTITKNFLHEHHETRSGAEIDVQNLLGQLFSEMGYDEPSYHIHQHDQMGGCDMLRCSGTIDLVAFIQTVMKSKSSYLHWQGNHTQIKPHTSNKDYAQCMFECVVLNLGMMGVLGTDRSKTHNFLVSVDSLNCFSLLFVWKPADLLFRYT